ncbi:MAG: YceH family protein [Pseudomonadota bacterium]|nr:YceH family protein [Pseudomonadota bacterium]
MNFDPEQPLDALEMRVLAVLAEKESLTPDNYPMSLNALVNGCNQLTSRDPVMTASEREVIDALQRLQQNKLVTEVSQVGARVAKYEHRLRPAWSLEQSKLAALTVLMLRGSQTAAEIRARSERLHPFDSVQSVEQTLQFLIDKFPPLVTRLPRAPGTKETRYACLLAGADALASEDLAASTGSGTGSQQRGDRLARLEDEITQLRAELAALSAQFAQFKQQFE